MPQKYKVGDKVTDINAPLGKAKYYWCVIGEAAEFYHIQNPFHRTSQTIRKNYVDAKTRKVGKAELVLSCIDQDRRSL